MSITLKPFAEQCAPVLIMLSGKTPWTLCMGFLIFIFILCINKTSNLVMICLDSGIEGTTNMEYISDTGNVNPQNIVKKGQLLQDVIVNVKLKLPGINSM